MAKAYSGPVEINGKSYEIAGALYKQRVVEFPEAAPQDSQQSRQARRFLQSFNIGTINGLLVDRDYDNDLSMCYDSTLETRFPGQITLPGLWVAEGTWTVYKPTGITYTLIGGVSFDDKVWVVYGYDDSANSVHYLYARYYVTSAEEWADTDSANNPETVESQADGVNDYDFIAHDLKVHGSYLICVYLTPTSAVAWERRIRRREIGESDFDNDLNPDPGNFPETAATTYDHSLLCSIRDRLYLAAWNSSTKVVTVHYSTDSGVTWTTAAATTVTTTAAPTAFIPYVDDDGIEVPHLGTPEGVYRYDIDGDNPLLVVDLREHGDANNCRGMIGWGQTGALYIPVASEPLGRIIEYRISDGVRYERAVGLNLGSGLPAARQGYVISLKPGGVWLFALVKQTSSCAIFAFDGKGWHHVHQVTVIPQLMCLSHLSTGRLHLLHGGSTTADAEHVKYPLENPVAQSSFVYATSGYIDLPWFAGGLAEISAAWLKAHVDADGLDAANTGEYIKLQYGKDGDTARTANTPAESEFLSGTPALRLPTGTATNAGVSSKKFVPRLTFYRAAGDTTSSPKLYNFSVDYLKVPTVRHYYRLVIDVKATESKGSRTREQIYADLDTLEDLVTQATFSFPGVSTVYVKVMEPTPGITFEGSDMPNVLRKYAPGEDKVEMILLELI